ncbi:MAG: RHS repeat-associated core domain-containing protein, partial [Gemmatimonadaceae bacterium]
RSLPFLLRFGCGILGDGTTADRAVPTPVRTPSALPPVAPPARDVGTAPPELDAVDAPEPAADALEAVALAASSAGAAATLSPAAPQVALVNSDSVAARDECLTISAGSQAAYQCGDLRIVHPLPSVRLRNRLRTPTLVYNSQLARPAPVLAADVTVPTGADVPDTVRATVTFDEFAETWTRAWPGASWGSAGTTRRIAVPADGMSTPYHPTQSFTVDIAFCYNGAGCQHTVQTSWQTVWDRRTSPFGAGWWLAGLEQLEPSQKVVASGDGSAVPYRGVSTGRWAKAPLDRPDTLQAYYGNCGTAGCEYLSERQAEHGGKVIFHEWGAHEQTIGRLGDTTRFTYDSVGRLQSIVLSPGGTAGTYTFAYSSGQVQITAPPAGSIARVTTIFLTGTRVDSIRDADAHKTSFTYDGSTTRIASRTNKLGAVTKYAYDAGGKLALDSVQFTATQFAVTSFSAAETRGVLSAVSPDSAYTLLDGPRTDVSDVTRVWVGRFGAPVKIANALGDSTLLFRSNTAFPALVTSVRAPSGLVTRAAYDARGNPDSTTAVDPYGDGRDATTRYQWAPQWDFVTHVTLPEGEVTTMQYDSLTGNRLWQEDGRGTSSRVNFAYYTSGSGRGLLKTVAYPGGARDSVGYDSTGNLALTRAPLGHETRFENDGIGRAVVVRTHLDTLRTIWQDDSTTYDLNDQPTYTVSYGPAFDGAAAQRLIVRRFYDVGGQLDSLQRWSNPDPNILGTITTRWRYDAAGRRTAEVAPDGAVDSTWYDRAGNADSVHTRRGHRIVMQYDALGRLQKRILPEVVYGDTTPYSGQRFPRYPTCQTTKLCIPADTATFTYDAAGNVLTADNRDALIRRAYHRNGTLAADSLRIRTLAELGAGGNFTSHAYGLRFGYDLNGRRTWLKHPSQLAATLSSTPGVVYDSAAYGYDPATGALSRVRDVLGNVFRYAYDLNGRVDTLAYPQGHFKRFAYDLDGRVTLIRQDRTATDPLGLDYNEITLLYDVRGKLTTAQPLSVDPNGRLSYSYTALGTLKTEERSFTTDIRSDINSFAVDALGNSRTTTYSFSQTGLDNSGHTAQSTGSQPTTFTYQAATGRLLGSTLSGSSKYDQLDNVQDCPDSWQAEQRTYRHDRGGNVDWSTTDHVDTAQVRNVLTCVPSYVQTGRGATASYYGADDRLRVQDARVILSSGATVIGAAYEEHRYDALGRRVLHRTRNCVDVPDCLSQSVRVVWDGDQLLDEILFTEQDPERDDVTAYGQYSGRVLYTHGLEIDQPLTATRVGYDSSGACQAVAIAPDWDWRGQGYGHATYKPGAACNPQMKWPKRYAYLKSLMWAQYESGVGAQEMGGFFGSLLTDQRDASGQLYRRNRYYDPQTGRFTQEDPIGLAGGVNLYGFAGADPVNFSDPFGLCPPNDKNQGDCQQVTALQSLQILASAIASGEWTYSQYPSGRTNDPSTAKAGETLGDCTDFCRSAVKSALGKVWVGGPKSSTAMFKAGNHSGFAEVSRTEARAGDIVVQGGHAGIMIGIDEAGNVYGWANNGSPTRADGSGYKDSTTGTRKFNDGSFGKGTPRFYRPLVKPEQ